MRCRRLKRKLNYDEHASVIPKKSLKSDFKTRGIPQVNGNYFISVWASKLTF
jgi:hypothetical protein